MGVRSLWPKSRSRKRGSAMERAESAYTDKQYAEAAALFREQAETGDAAAQLRLAQLYESGQGVLQSFVEATSWYSEAARQGSVPAQARLGKLLALAKVSER